MDKINFNGANSLDQLRFKKNIDNERNVNESREKAVSNPLAVNDQVNVSDRASSVQQMVDKISSIPDVRQERVNALRQQVQAGSYNPSSNKIAEAILREDN